MSACPLGLTAGQIDSLKALIEHGCHKSAAAALGLHPQTVAHHLANARKRAGVVTSLQLAIQYDRAIRSISGQDVETRAGR